MAGRRDRELGIDRPITRRDFLDGVRIAVAGSFLAPELERARKRETEYYPPALTGMRGSAGG
jgi:spermidine dehydrogenase